ncbi:Hsp70 family protein [Prochlorococcus sp. MIT 1223]|uniref:Hsp70 family protein n=1 Tax=Prochlorococcus sp. MIT 1223 TaxID=3096217 RepID=UPI002A7652C2|nr:Hsp70 family protein [Prochlorococcus sp. MIT 1223]
MESEQIKPNGTNEEVGTLAIDLGNSNTVVAFQGELNSEIKLLDLADITRTPGEIPSLVWSCKAQEPFLAVGNEVSKLGLQDNNNICSDFKRWIGASDQSNFEGTCLTPEKAGEVLINEIWKRIPKTYKVKRLVLTAPVETYQKYRAWLFKVCSELKVNEIALVDEPTAAAMGAGLEPGSKLLVVDIGGSTIDMSIVALEGGEGKAQPVAQLLRFGGQDLEQKSNQVLRCAKVLGKAGQRIGGRDIDRWIANHLFPNSSLNQSTLNAAERLKCRLSDPFLKDTKILFEKEQSSLKEDSLQLGMSKVILEELLQSKGLIKILEALFDHTLSSSKKNGCNLEDLDKVVLVGGGSRIPIIQRWLKDKCMPIELLMPPSIEAIAIGALSLTPGVRVRDVLQKGISIRCWDQKNKIHIWHPLFLAGQPWPTSKPLEIVLGASNKNQQEIEIKTGEPNFEGVNEIIYVNGIPTIKDGPIKPTITSSKEVNTSIKLDSPAQPGEDCLKLKFNINENCELTLHGLDLRNNQEIGLKTLGSIR